MTAWLVFVVRARASMAGGHHRPRQRHHQAASPAVAAPDAPIGGAAAAGSARGGCDWTGRSGQRRRRCMGSVRTCRLPPRLPLSPPAPPAAPACVPAQRTMHAHTCRPPAHRPACRPSPSGRPVKPVAPHGIPPDAAPLAACAGPGHLPAGGRLPGAPGRAGLHGGAHHEVRGAAASADAAARAPQHPRATLAAAPAAVLRRIVVHFVALLVLMTHVVGELVLSQHIEILRSGDGEQLLVRACRLGCCMLRAWALRPGPWAAARAHTLSSACRPPVPAPSRCSPVPHPMPRRIACPPCCAPLPRTRACPRALGLAALPSTDLA